MTVVTVVTIVTVVAVVTVVTVVIVVTVVAVVTVLTKQHSSDSSDKKNAFIMSLYYLEHTYLPIIIMNGIFLHILSVLCLFCTLVAHF